MTINSFGRHQVLLLSFFESCINQTTSFEVEIRCCMCLYYYHIITLHDYSMLYYENWFVECFVSNRSLNTVLRLLGALLSSLRTHLIGGLKDLLAIGNRFGIHGGLHLLISLGLTLKGALECVVQK